MCCGIKLDAIFRWRQYLFKPKTLTKAQCQELSIQLCIQLKTANLMHSCLYHNCQCPLYLSWKSSSVSFASTSTVLRRLTTALVQHAQKLCLFSKTEVQTCSVSDQPDVWQWQRSLRESSLWGSKFCFNKFAQRRLAALNLAISCNNHITLLHNV